MRLSLLSLAIALTAFSTGAVAMGDGDWQFIGPSKPAEQGEGLTIGRINAIAFDPNDRSTMYAGTPGSGLWRTKNGGESWTVLTEDLPVLGISDIAIDPTNADTIYIMTGDGEAFDTPSIGVMKSVDGGASWQPTGTIFPPDQIEYGHRLALNPAAPTVLLAAMTTGLYRTTDGGTNWDGPLIDGEVFDILFHTDDPSVVYAASATTVYRSTDTGATWQALSNGLPQKPRSNRIRLAVTEAKPDWLYVLFGARAGFTVGLYRSEDRGESFVKRSSSPAPPQEAEETPPIDLTKPNIFGWFWNDFGSQSSYDLAMAVSPTNADRVNVGGVDTWRSDDGGVTWQVTSRWTNDPRRPDEREDYTHADIHVLVYHGDSLFAATDGGLYRSENGGDTWASFANMSSGISSLQVYSVCGSPDDPTLLFFGAQDNGTWRLEIDDEANEVEADQVLTGDGMVCQVNPVDSSIVFASYYNGYLTRSDDFGQSFTLNIPPPPNQFGEAQWLVPYTLVPDDPSTVLACFADVWSGREPNFQWTNISAGALGASKQCKQIAVAPSDPKTIYVAKDAERDRLHRPGEGDSRPPFLGGGGVFRSTDGGATWQVISGPLPLNEAGPSYLAVSPTDAKRVWVTFAGRAAGVKVFATTDGGETWVNVSQGLPNLPVNTVAVLNSSAHSVFVGMDDGVYYRDDNLSEFKAFKNGMPNVVVRSFWIDQEAQRLFAGTYAQGIWQTSVKAP